VQITADESSFIVSTDDEFGQTMRHAAPSIYSIRATESSASLTTSFRDRSPALPRLDVTDARGAI